MNAHQYVLQSHKLMILLKTGVHRKSNVVKCYNKLAGELFEDAARPYKIEQFEKYQEKIKDFGPGLYEYCFGSYLDEENLEITTDKRHYYRSKMEVRNQQSTFKKMKILVSNLY